MINKKPPIMATLYLERYERNPIRAVISNIVMRKEKRNQWYGRGFLDALAFVGPQGIYAGLLAVGGSAIQLVGSGPGSRRLPGPLPTNKKPCELPQAVRNQERKYSPYGKTKR